VFPVRCGLAIYIPEDGILHLQAAQCHIPQDNNLLLNSHLRPALTKMLECNTIHCYRVYTCLSSNLTAVGTLGEGVERVPLLS
jgi:hypothetical protein